MEEDYFKGRGAQINTPNPHLKQRIVTEHSEGLDEPLLQNELTQYIREHPKKVVNKVNSPDVGMAWSVNAYQGCEHGCVYCYARTTHQYWGWSAGLDFERKIIVKENAPQLLEKHLQKPGWKGETIVFSGNTDCYQPAEKRFRLTRKMLEVCLKYGQPVGIITKNSLVLRDLEVLMELNKRNLVAVHLSITSLKEDLRRKLEPRTATASKRLKVVETLAANNIPVNVMVAPIIPGLTSQEVPQIVKAVALRGASSVNYTIVRLNGHIAELFEDWLRKNYPDRADKVLNQIRACHGGQLKDSRFATRMRGEGKVADSIRQLFQLSKRRYLNGRQMRPLESSHFCPARGKQLPLF
ncbi:MAG: PA0069 family radical SAM protein [Salibacteraceae bacterium]